VLENYNNDDQQFNNDFLMTVSILVHVPKFKYVEIGYKY